MEAALAFLQIDVSADATLADCMMEKRSNDERAAIPNFDFIKTPRLELMMGMLMQ